MDTPTKRKTLRLTPVPRGAVSPPSLIVILRVPRLSTTLPLPPHPHPHPHPPPSTPAGSSRRVCSLEDLASQHKSLSPKNQIPPTVDHVRDTIGNISPDGSNIFSSPELASSTSTTTPGPGSPLVLPEYILLDNRRLAAAKETVGIFYKWGREDVIEELNGAIQVQNNVKGSTELEVITKKAWVRESLRHRYNVYIQMYSDYVELHRPLRVARSVSAVAGVRNEPGKECEFPGCGREFVYGDYRVAFEPPGWSIPLKPKVLIQDTASCDAGDLNPDPQLGSEDTRTIIREVVEDPIILLPDYHKLLTRGKIPDNDRGEFYCPICFEKLLDLSDFEKPTTVGRPVKRKKTTDKRTHPSPLCRIYSSVYAETRSSEEGRYGLDYEACELVRRWKDVIFDEKTRSLWEKFREVVFKSKDDEEKVVEDDDGESWAKVQVGGGRGLAECLAALKGESKVPKGRKKAKY